MALLRTFFVWGDIVMLVKCGECGKLVSTNAVFCPNCGNQPMGECVKCIKNDGCDSKQYLGGFACHSPRGCCPGFDKGAYPLDPEGAERSASLWADVDPDKQYTN